MTREIAACFPYSWIGARLEIVGRILDWLRRVPTNDPFERKSATIMQVFCIGLTLLLSANAIAFFAGSSVPKDGMALYGVFADVASIAASVAGIVLIRRGAVRAAFVTVLGTYLAILSGSLAFRGLAYHQNLLVRVFWVLLVLPALLLGRRELWGALSVLLGAMFVGHLRDAGHLGGTGPQTPPHPAFGDWTQATVVMLLLCIILDRFGTALREAYSAARARQLEAEAASEALGAANRSLADEMERRVHAESMLFQAQKLEAIGRLSAGVAHDFNNVLTGIVGFAELLKSSLSPGDARRGDVEQIVLAADRASTLTRQLLAFGRRQIIEPKNLLVEDRVRALEPMLHQVLGEDVEIVERFDAAPWSVHVDQVQLDQVLLNLCLNARDAMPHGGRLTISTEKTGLNAAEVASLPDLAPGEYVRFSVADTGIGMSETTLQSVFEPFFTTKGQGKGTGLGLANCYGMVRQAGGVISARSALGKGTTFEILLPRASPEPGVSPTRSAFVRRADTPRSAGETLLIVDDDAPIREIAARVLRGAGYSVLTARDPVEGAAVAAAHRGEIALLLTDVVMPGGNGRRFAEELRRTRAGMGVLYISGYSEDVIARHGVLDLGIELLTKPFSPEALTARVEEILARRRGNGEGHGSAREAS